MQGPSAPTEVITLLPDPAQVRSTVLTAESPNSELQSGSVPSGGHVRFSVLAILFFVTALNYASRATLSIAGASAASDLGLNPVTVGYAFSAFAWAYVIGQIPGGWLLDRFGSKRVYALSLLTWSVFVGLQGFVGWLPLVTAVASLFWLRFLMGLAESPAFPGNARIVAAWFPTSERGTASAVFNSAQYFATVLFAPLMGWTTNAFGWRYAFIIIGALGILHLPLWQFLVYSPREHPRLSREELDYIERGGGLVMMDSSRDQARKRNDAKWSTLRKLLGNRMLLGIYAGQYFITTLTYFFITWFPVYLIQERGLTVLKAGFIASVPAVCGFVGGILGGIISDHMLRSGYSLTAARKAPIVIGLLLSMSMIACNYVSAVWVVVCIMSLAFLGKGIGAMGWSVVSDTSPRESAGLSGGLFNSFGNIAGITTPIVIGYIVQGTRSFHGALVFVAGNAAAAILCYLVVVGEIRRVELSGPE
jgi:ACS family glucarate transporter-like MFS transporter